MKRARIGAVAVMACLLAVGSASALVLPFELQVGDKIFSEFSITGVDPAAVNVVGIGSGVPGDWYGIQINGPFTSLLGVGGLLDVAFNYSVRTADGRPLIHDIEQSFNLTSRGNGGSVAIGETVWDEGFGKGNVVAQSTVSYTFADGQDNDPPGELYEGDHLILDNLAEQVWVTKDILLVANPGGTVGATILWQRISQASVPDGGATVMMLGLVLTGLAAVRRKLA
jgi:hypothetical protein